VPLLGTANRAAVANLIAVNANHLRRLLHDASESLLGQAIAA